MKAVTLAQAKTIENKIKLVIEMIDKLKRDWNYPTIFHECIKLNPRTSRTIDQCKDKLIIDLEEEMTDLQKQFDEL